MLHCFHRDLFEAIYITPSIFNVDKVGRIRISCIEIELHGFIAPISSHCVAALQCITDANDKSPKEL